MVSAFVKIQVSKLNEKMQITLLTIHKARHLFFALKLHHMTLFERIRSHLICKLYRLSCFKSCLFPKDIETRVKVSEMF